VKPSLIICLLTYLAINEKGLTYLIAKKNTLLHI
jgi:hypothetical protein